MKNKANLIIPGAKFVDTDLQNEFGQIPPFLLPLMGKTVPEKIRESFGKGNIETYIGVQEGGNLVENYFDFFSDNSIHLVKIAISDSLSDTIEKTIQSDDKILEDPIIINFADTVVKDFDLSLIGEDFIYFSKTDETERWTLFKIRCGEIYEISDKRFIRDNDDWKTFVGLFGISNTKLFIDILKKENKEDKTKAFYNSIVKYFGTFTQEIFKESKQWNDCGHIDNYYSARKKIINTRYFNQVYVNEMAGTLTKTSINKKLRNEIKWYLSIPKELRYFVPNIFEYSTDYLKPSIEMELYSYPSLDDYFVYSNIDFDSWDKIFRKICSIIKIASKYTVNDSEIGKDLEKMYYRKTIDRLNEYLNSNTEIQSLKNLKINGKKTISIYKIIDSLDTLIERFNLYNVSEFQVIHGDLCFSNILFDRKNGIIKLIDPRGEFGKYLIYGDVYYDLAKLSHSVLGMYDFIILNQYKITKEGNDSYFIKFRCSEYHQMIGQIFIKHMTLNKFDLSRIRFTEALLFLSMLPLHKDNPTRQKVMLFRGLEIITDLLEN